MASVMLLGWGCSSTQTTTTTHEPVLIIFYDGLVGKQPLLNEIAKQKASIVYTYRNFNALSVRLPQNTNEAKAIKRFQKVEGVLSVQQNRLLHLDQK